MASVTRQPFAPLNEARLQTLTSLKNRQNASPSTPAGKRKVESTDFQDSENVDPALSAKRSKTSTASPFAADLVKPANFVLTRTITTPYEPRPITSPVKAASTPRRTLQPKSPAAKLNTSFQKSLPLSVPAGRSPTRGKRSGILSNRRRTAGPFTRIDPPAFQLDASAPFSLDAALKGTIPSYSARPKPAKSSSLLDTSDMKASWFFDIHEDTPEQEMTNLLQHGTCVLDISSDEESERKATQDRAEGRDKENVPPADDISQTSARNAPRLSSEEMIVEKERTALGEMTASDFYPEGCDESTVIFVPTDDPEEVATECDSFEFAPKLDLGVSDSTGTKAEIDVLMAKESEASSKAAVLQPMDGTGESFELWESGSVKDETELAGAPAQEGQDPAAQTSVDVVDNTEAARLVPSEAS